MRFLEDCWPSTLHLTPLLPPVALPPFALTWLQAARWGP